MGALISKFRKSQTTTEILEQIDKDIAHLEKFRKANQDLRQKVIGKLTLYSVLLYIAGAFSLYFFFMPQEWIYKLYGLLPFMLFPFLVYFLKSFLHWFFVRKIAQNEGEMQSLQDRRKDILENVMETETYKKAKEILEKFDPETKRDLEEKNKRVEENNSTVASQPGLRRRLSHSNSPGMPSNGAQGMPVPISPPTRSNPQSANGPPGFIPGTPVSVLPRPILPLNKTPVDKLMDYMIGDGANQRYALVCRHCCSHNGMALKEEFQYLAFRCAYCRFFNAARKLRPNAPQLPTSTRRIDLDPSREDSNEDTSSSTSASEASPEPATVIEKRDSSATETAESDNQHASANSTDAEEMIVVDAEEMIVVAAEDMIVEVQEEPAAQVAEGNVESNKDDRS